MLLSNSQIDPIVEILRLAYRRGLAIRQEQVKQTIESAKSSKRMKSDIEQPTTDDSNQIDSSLGK